MPSTEHTLTDSWTDLGAGPAAIQVQTFGEIRISRSAAEPVTNAGSFIVQYKGGDPQRPVLDFGGTEKLWGRADLGSDVTIAVMSE